MTSTPRQCQLVWKDKEERTADRQTDLVYSRLYLNSTGVYTIVYMWRTEVITLWINSTDYRLKITVPVPAKKLTEPTTPSYELYDQAGVRIGTGSGGSARWDKTTDQYHYCEAYLPFNAIRSYTPLSAGEYVVSMRISEDAFAVQYGNTHVDRLRVVVSDYYIVHVYYVVDTTTVPIPVPEPGLLVAAAACATVVGAMLVLWRGGAGGRSIRLRPPA